MTDITDQDRRTARQWAEGFLSEPGVRGTRATTAARYILATVGAGAPTLAEELARIAENSPVWTIQNVCDELKSAAARAEQVEHDLAEARAEVERLKHDLGEAYQTRDARDDEVDRLRAEVETLTYDLTEAESEVDRLDGEAPQDVPYQFINSIREMLKEATTNPANVKPGEAWIVEVFGKRRTAVKDRGGVEPWNTVSADDGYPLTAANEDVTLVSRLVPAPRVITDRDGLDRAKRLTVIRDGVGVVCERAALGDGWFTTGNGVDQTPYIQFPVTVLWEPDA